MQTPLYNLQAEQIGEVDLPDQAFGVSWNPDLVHQALVTQQANRRAVLAHTKGRSEVRGGGRKPWRQKGTGRARHGSIRSPLWKGGGVTFGPTSERNFSKKINKKMKRKALFAVLSQKIADDAVRVVEDLGVASGKTRDARTVAEAFFKGEDPSVLLIVRGNDANTVRATRNLSRAEVISADSLNIESVLKHQRILMDKEAVDIIVRHYAI